MHMKLEKTLTHCLHPTRKVLLCVSVRLTRRTARNICARMLQRWEGPGLNIDAWVVCSGLGFRGFS
jgi:hypothetical protein